MKDLLSAVHSFFSTDRPDRVDRDVDRRKDPDAEHDKRVVRDELDQIRTHVDTANSQLHEAELVLRAHGWIPDGANGHRDQRENGQ